MNKSIRDIIRTVGLITVWCLCALIGFVVFCTIGGALVAFASTGIGALILLVVGYKIYKDWYRKE